MSTQHKEFPELTPEARAACEAGYKAAFPWHDGHKEEWTESNRKGKAAFLLEALNQAGFSPNHRWIDGPMIGKVFAIAYNLHSPPPPPPTLAQAREANLLSPEGRDLVCAFLLTLGEGVQP